MSDGFGHFSVKETDDFIKRLEKVLDEKFKIKYSIRRQEAVNLKLPEEAENPENTETLANLKKKEAAIYEERVKLYAKLFLMGPVFRLEQKERDTQSIADEVSVLEPEDFIQGLEDVFNKLFMTEHQIRALSKPGNAEHPEDAEFIANLNKKTAAIYEERAELYKMLYLTTADSQIKQKKRNIHHASRTQRFHRLPELFCAVFHKKDRDI